MPNSQKLKVLRNHTYLGEGHFTNEIKVFDLIQNEEFATAMEVIAKEKLFYVRDNHGLTLLHWAAIANSTELANFLIDNGVYVNIRDHHEFTPLHWAARTGSGTVTKLLLEKGASIHAENIYGELAFHWAAWVGNLPFVKYSIHHGIDVNQLTKRNKSALEGALHAEEKEVVKYLTRKGAKPKTSWTLAEWQTLVRLNEIEKLKQIPQEAIQGLTQKEIDFQVELNLRYPRVIDSRVIETIKYLLNHYAASLDYIANCNSIELAQAFIECGADINKKSRRITFRYPQSSEIENTLLHNAIEANNLPLIQFALEQGADIYATNSDNLTVLQLAISKDDAKLTDLLLKNIVERTRILAEILQDRYKRTLLDCIETQRIKDGFYQLVVEDSNDLLKPIADFLQLALWGNLDRKFPLNNQSGRQNQSIKSFRTQTLADSIETFHHKNQLASEISKCTLRIAHIYAENKNYAAHLRYLLQLIMDAYTAPEIKKHEKMIALLNTRVALKFSSFADEVKHTWLKTLLNTFIDTNFSESQKLKIFLEIIACSYLSKNLAKNYQIKIILFGLIREISRRFVDLEKNELANKFKTTLSTNDFITQLKIQILIQNGLAYLQENLQQLTTIAQAMEAIKLFVGDQKWEAALLLIDKFKIDFDALLDLLQHLSKTPATATQLGKLYHQFPAKDWYEMSQTLGRNNLQSAFTNYHSLDEFREIFNKHFNVDATIEPLDNITKGTYLQIHLQKSQYEPDQVIDILIQLAKLKVAHKFTLANNITFYNSKHYVIKINEPVQAFAQKLLTTQILNQNNFLPI